MKVKTLIKRLQNLIELDKSIENIDIVVGVDANTGKQITSISEIGTFDDNESKKTCSLISLNIFRTR